jgi:ADP-heptose:LPS heptosyltransferase
MFCDEPRRAELLFALQEAGIGLGCQVVTAELSNLAKEFSKVQYMLCHDSLAAHLAVYKGLNVVLIQGATDPAVWSPTPHVITAGNLCQWYPCHGVVQCLQSSSPFICIKSVEAADAVRELEKARRRVLRED